MCEMKIECFISKIKFKILLLSKTEYAYFVFIYVLTVNIIAVHNIFLNSAVK